MTTPYTQNVSEQIEIMRHARIFSTPQTVLDIGAGNGRTYSNSLALIEAGWNAILIEASPFAFAKLLELHGNNPNVTLLNCTIGTENRIVKFYECEDNLYSTTHIDKAVALDKEGKKLMPYWVSQLTPQRVLEQLGLCADVLSIDIEGSSVDVLMGCPIKMWGTSLIIVEHDGRAIELSGWGRERGFSVIDLTAENIILKKQNQNE